jgi:para-nitrobenzyl esterase
MGDATAPIVTTTAGRVEGRFEGGAAAFLGVPYAAPPFGSHRFQAPQPVTPWDGVRPALAFGHTAPQPHRQFTLVPEPVQPGPDCLNLNVFTPDPSPAASLPVLVWIHGGGFTAGSNASPWYRGERFAARGVVTVSMNYRLGAEGFLVLPDASEAPHNRAVRDWVAALEWVQANIAAFGGDPSKVTIAGQSAGGVACSTLLVTPAAKGLFRGAICMSGARLPSASPDQAAALTTAIAEEVGVAPTFAALREVDPERLMEAQEPAGARAATATRTEGRQAGLQLSFNPIVDGDLIPAKGLRVDPDVAVMAGATAEEFNSAMRTARDSMDDARLERRLGRLGLDDDAIAAYRGRNPDAENWWLYGQAFSDSSFKAGALRTVEGWTEGGGRAWLYDFEWRSAVAGYGSVHCLDLPFAFDNLDASGVAEVTGEAPPQELADAMHGAFVRFIQDGDPGWPAYDLDRRPAMVFDATSKVVDDPWRFERETWLGRSS